MPSTEPGTDPDWQAEPTCNLPDLVRRDLRKRWRGGERLSVEHCLANHPALRADAEAIADLIETEAALRREFGECPQAEEYRRRFPDLAAQIERRFQGTEPLTVGPPLVFADLPTLDVPSSPAEMPTLEPPPHGPPTPAYGTTPSQAPGMPLVPGYRVLGVLGRGGMGVVYRAWQVAARRLVALKMIRSGAHAAPQELARFRTEAEAAARLHHPNIAQVYEVSDHDGLPYFSLEYVDGGSLAERLHGTPFPARKAAALIETLARALHHAHAQGVVHRDLKPGNVLLQIGDFKLSKDDASAEAEFLASATPKVTDFGLAKLMEGGENQTQSEAILGTPSYMAPEQAAGKTKQAGPAADIYSLGAMLYELLTGRPPFKATTLADTLQQVIADDPVPPRRLQGRLPRDLDTICLKCLQKEPHKRYASALDLADDLHRYQKDRPVQARPVGWPERGRKWARRHPAGAALVALSAFGLAGLLVGGWAFAAAQTRAARRETTLRQEADLSFHQALTAVDRMLTRVGAVDLAEVPEMAPVRERLLGESLEFFADFLARRGDDPAVRFEAARAFGRTGDILALQVQDGVAVEAYNRALDLLGQLPADRAVRREQGRDLNGLGAVLRRSNRFADAETAYRRALELRQGLHDEERDRPEYRQELAATRYLLGALLAQQGGRRPEAEEAYAAALATQEELTRAYPKELEYRRELARTLNNLGLLQANGGEAEMRRATETLAKALDYQNALIRQAPTVPRYRRELGRTHNNLGQLYERLNRFQDAMKEYFVALEQQATLAREYPTEPEYRYDLATTHRNIGSLWTFRGVFDQAESPFRAAVDFCRRLTADHPEVPAYHSRLGQTLGELGRLLAHTGRGHEAETNYREALAEQESLVADFPTVPEYHSELGRALENLAWLLYERAGAQGPGVHLDALLNAAGGNTLAALGLPARERAALAEASRLARRAVAEQQEAAATSGARNPVYRRYLGEHQVLLTDVLLRLGDHAQAAAAAEELPRFDPDEFSRPFQAAAVLARCAALAAGDARLAYAARAVQLLREGITRPGLRLAERERALKWLNEPPYESLRRRDDFQKLLKDAANQAQIGVG